MTMFERYSALMSPDGVEAGGSSSTPAAAPASSGDASGTESGASSPSSPSPSASPAPSTPTTAPSKGPDSAAAGEAFDFETIFGDGPEDSAAALAAEVPPAAPQVPPEVTAPQAPAAPAVAGQPAAASPTAAPAPAAVQGAPDQSTPPAQESPYIDPYDPAALGDHLMRNEADATNLVAERLFQLSAEEKEALEADVIGTIPKLLAKVFVKSQQNVLTQLGRMIPVMTQRHLEGMRRNLTNEMQFYQRWPDIKSDLHGETVRKYAAVYRQMHPQATLGQMIEDLGPMVMMASKIVPSVSAPAAPGAPARAVNGRSPPPSPFVPAGAGPATASRTVEQNAWEAMFNQPDG